MAKEQNYEGRSGMKTLLTGFELKNVDDEGEFTGYGATFGDVDQGMDMITQGAFKKSIDRWKAGGPRPKMLWQHDADNVIGVWDEMEEDQKGLRVKGRLLKEIQKGAEALALMRNGAIDSMSIGYKVNRASFGGADNSIRVLEELELWEISMVTFPMNRNARVTAVKRLEHVRDVEGLLRDAGVPNTFAKLVAKHGYEEATKRLADGSRDATKQVDEEGLDDLRAKLQKLKGAFNG